MYVSPEYSARTQATRVVSQSASPAPLGPAYSSVSNYDALNERFSDGGAALLSPSSDTQACNLASSHHSVPRYQAAPVHGSSPIQPLTVASPSTLYNQQTEPSALLTENRLLGPSYPSNPLRPQALVSVPSSPSASAVSPQPTSSAATFNPRRYERPGLTLEEICEVKEAFDLFDSDQKGYINPKELKSAILALSQQTFATASRANRTAEGAGVGTAIAGLREPTSGIRNQVLYQMISDLDGYSSHSITFEEFLDMMTARMSERGAKDDIYQVFRLFDDDHSGSITVKKLQRVAAELGEKLSEDELREMIRRADSDGDGHVTIDDFLSVMRKGGGIV